MTMQFLASVRRNQRQWMVVLTILAIFAFLFDDVVRGTSNLGANGTALFIAVLCAGGMSIIGYPRGHTVLFGAIGLVVGGGVALVAATYTGPKAPVKTVFGSLSNQKIKELQIRRKKANEFLMSAVQKVSKGRNAPNFGDLSVSSMVSFSVLHHEAKRQGVTVSDEAVNRYIQAATEEMLGEKDYLEALSEVGIGEPELFDIIRGELEAQVVGRLLSPPYSIQQRIEEMNRFYRMINQPQGQIPSKIASMTPEQLWQHFRKLHVRQQLTAVAVPVSEFVKQVPEPSDSELRAYFDARKSLIGDDRGNPGFLELPKVRLGYLVASNLENFEKGLSGATDQELADYYEKHKEQYRIFGIPDSSDGMPDLKGGVDSPDPDAPADASTPANVATEKPVEGSPAPSNPPSTDKPTTDKPTTDKPTPDKPAGEAASDKKEPAKKAEDKPAASEPKAKEEPKCEDDIAVKKEDGAKPATEELELPKPAAAEKGDSTPPAPDLPSSDTNDVLPKLHPPRFDPTAPVRYRALDDELKLQIREKILLEKTFEKMGEAADHALAFMNDLNLKYLSATDPAEQAKLAATFADECKRYAKKSGLEYHETKEMTRRELATSMDEQIGGATEVKAGNVRRNLQSVTELAFETVSSGREKDMSQVKYRLSLYSPQRADTPKAKYAYWKIAEIPAKVPEFSNESTKQLVVDSWKYEKARGLAEQRAKDLAELVKKSPSDIPAALSGQTINGTKDSPTVTVRETSKFTWIRVPNSVPTMGMQFPSESPIDDIDQPGSDFLKLVFEQLGEGDVGVGLNRPRTVFYVVRVHDRDGTDASDGSVAMQAMQQMFLRERFASFPPTPYDFLAIETQLSVEERWRQTFNKRFGVTFEDRKSPESDGE